MFKISLLVAVSLVFLSCGKMLPPSPPEAYSPKPVSNLVVSTDTGAVNFAWDASDQAQNGKELKDMGGYNVYRKTLNQNSDLRSNKIKFDLITSIPDMHVAELIRLRDEAIEKGQLSRKVEVDEKLKKFSFSDKTAQPGQLYAYRIVPFNQGGVEGAYDKIVRVSFRGASSEVFLFDDLYIAEEEVE
jgi:hypothetical protein